MSDKSEWIQAAVERFERPLITYTVRLTGDLETARDVVQDTFLKLWQADMAELDGRLAPWLYRVCRNRAVDVLRKDGRMIRMDDEHLEGRSATDRPSSPRQGAVGTTRLMSLMHTLPERQQEILRLKFQGGLSYRQIADVMDLTVSNVGFLLHVSIKALREQLTGGETAEAAREA